MFSAQLRSSLAAQQSSAKLMADGTDQQRLEALTSFGFGLRPVEELLVTAESDRRKVWTPSERARVLATLEKLSYIREAEVPRDALMECLDKIKLKSLVQDEYVFSQGDLNRSFYIVLSGQIHFCEPANKVRPAALGCSGRAPLDGLSSPLCLSSPPSPPLCLCLSSPQPWARSHTQRWARSPTRPRHTHAHALARCARALHCTHARSGRAAAVWRGRARSCWAWRGRATASGSSASSQASRARWARVRRRTATCSSSTASCSASSSPPCRSARWRAARWRRGPRQEERPAGG